MDESLFADGHYSCRRVDNGFNILEGVLKNKWFMLIQFIIVGGQILIIFVGGAAFSVKPLNGPQWAVGLVLGVISVPVAVVLRLIPDELIEKIIPAFLSPNKKGPEVVVSDEESRKFEWNPALEEIRDQLSFIKAIRGGRLRNLRHKLQHPKEFLPGMSHSESRDPSAPGTPLPENSVAGGPSRTPSPESRSRRQTRSRSSSAFGPAAAMAGVVAGSIGGWSPIERAHDNDSMKFPNKSAHELFDTREGIEVHPDTVANDAIIGDYSTTTPPSQNPDLVPHFEHRPPEVASPSNRSRKSMRTSRSRSRSFNSDR